MFFVGNPLYLFVFTSSIAIITAITPVVNVYHAGFNDPKSLLDEHGLNQVKEQNQENIR